MCIRDRCGPFTLASHLRGNDIFMDMFDDEDYVKDLLGFCADCAKRMSDLYLDAGMDVIAVVDPLVSQISSDHFEEFLSAPYTELFRYLREEKQAFSSFFVCGNATRNIEVMCRTAPDSISVDEDVYKRQGNRLRESGHNIVAYNRRRGSFFQLYQRTNAAGFGSGPFG